MVAMIWCYDVAVVSFNGNDYRIHFWYMSKDEGVDLIFLIFNWRLVIKNIIISGIKSTIVWKTKWWQTHLQYKIPENQNKILPWWGCRLSWSWNAWGWV